MCWCGLCLDIDNNHDTDCGNGDDRDNDEVCTLGGRHRLGRGRAERRGGDLPGGK